MDSPDPDLDADSATALHSRPGPDRGPGRAVGRAAEPAADRAGAFARLIDVAPVDVDVFVGPPAPERGGRMFGGQLLAQSLAAAGRTVDGRPVHSLHAYFIRGGDVSAETTFTVERMRDGRSFALRSVSATQGGSELFRMTASFHAEEEGFEYQPGDRYPIDRVPPPDDVEMTYTDFTFQHPDIEPGSWWGHERPIEIRYVNPPDAPSDALPGVPIVEPQLTWIRIVGDVGPDRATNDIGLAYLSDATLVDHVTLPHGHRWQDARLTGTSLDHAMWFHRPARADQWLLFDQRVESTGGARGLTTGRLYDRDGALIATCGQEGLMRWSSH